MSWKSSFSLACTALLLGVYSPAWALDACDVKTQNDYRPVESHYQRGLLFKAEKCGLPTSYIFATIHSDKREISQAVQEAFHTLSDVQAAGFEYIMTPDTAKQVQRSMYLPPDAPGLKSRLGEAYFKRLSRMLKAQGFAADVVDRMRPWAAAVLLQAPDNDTQEGVVLDDQLQRMATEKHLVLFGLETPEEQFSVFNGLSESMQIDMLREAIDDDEEMDAINVDLDRSYLDKNLLKIATLGKQAFEQVDDPKLRTLLRTRLLDNRNRIMVKRMLPWMQKGPVMIAVGALHLPGDGGILEQLEKHGYLISVVD